LRIGIYHLNPRTQEHEHLALAGDLVMDAKWFGEIDPLIFFDRAATAYISSLVCIIYIFDFYFYIYIFESGRALQSPAPHSGATRNL